VSAPNPLFEAILNLARYHREHEKFYAHQPLAQAIQIQRASRVLKALANRWADVEPAGCGAPNPYAGCEDLNAPEAMEAAGVLFMEGEGEPAELERLKRDVAALAGDFESTGAWLAKAMEASWETGKALLPHPPLAGLLGERHRIIANDWQAAGISTLTGRLLRRALEVLEPLDLTPAGIRADLGAARSCPAYLYSASELLDRAADLTSESATLVHDNERRWRRASARPSRCGWSGRAAARSLRATS
jgi:hypothetical protein